MICSNVFLKVQQSALIGATFGFIWPEEFRLEHALFSKLNLACSNFFYLDATLSFIWLGVIRLKHALINKKYLIWYF